MGLGEGKAARSETGKIRRDETRRGAWNGVAGRGRCWEGFLHRNSRRRVASQRERMLWVCLSDPGKEEALG